MGSEPPRQGSGSPEPGERPRAERDTERILPVRSGAGSGDLSQQPDARFVGSAPVDEFTPPEIPAEELAGLRGDAPVVPIGQRRVLPLEEEPSGLVSRYLFPTERYRGEWKRHWIHLLPQFAIGTIATFILGFSSGFLARHAAASQLTTLAILVWVGVMGWAAWKVADWFFDRFILTNKRVMVVSGIITRRVAMMPLLRVTDMKYEQSPVGRMLNY